MLIQRFLENSAARYPDKVAVVHDAERVTYQQINTQADGLGRCLSENGIVKGDRVALFLENGIDYIVSYYATLKAGAAVAPLSPGLKRDSLQYLLDDLEPAAIIANFKTERLLKAVNLSALNLKAVIIRSPRQKWSNATFRVLTFDESISTPNNPINSINSTNSINPVNPINSTDLASIIYTSGSTGKPKGVMLSHGNIVSNTLSICRYLSLTHEDIQMVILPFFYVMGKSLLNTHIASGGTVVINNRFMYPADIVNQMIDEQVTGFSGVPSTYAYLLNRSPLQSSREKLVSLRYCSQAGGHMATSLKQGLRKALPAHTQIFIMYGATEASARLTYLDPSFFESKIESIGKPISGVSIRIMDESGNEVPDGEEGELAASGPNIMSGYWKDPRATAAALRDRCYFTGDIGYRDSDGFLYVLRRKDSLLKVGGHRINPTELEDFLIATEQVIESSVIGLPDQLLGSRLIALVVPKSDTFDQKSLMRICAEGLPKYKRPARIISLRSLPRNANGKIDYEKCIEMANQLET